MDWTPAAITNFVPLRWYEQAAIQERKRTNRYTAYICCAFREYKFGDRKYKQMIIRTVLQNDTICPSDVSCLELVRTRWTQLSKAGNKLWRQRANFLNVQPRQGIFVNLLANAPEDNHSETRICLQEECDYLTLYISSFLKK